MPKHDPVPPRRGAPAPSREAPVQPAAAPAPVTGGADYERAASAWARYKAMMKWMALAAFVSVLLALLYLKSESGPISIHMVIATIAGVGLSVLVGTALMGLVFLSNSSGHDDEAARGGRE